MPSRWIEFVKEWSKNNNVSYGCALSDARMKDEYYKKYPKKLTKTIEDEKNGVVALLINEDYEKYVILTNGSVLKLEKNPKMKLLLTKADNIKDAFKWLQKNVERKNNRFFKNEYTYNQFDGSKEDYKLLDEYDLKIGNPSTETKLIFYDDFSKSFKDGDYAKKLAESIIYR
jgi:hypothetical protein